MAAPGSSIVNGGMLAAAWANFRVLFKKSFAEFGGDLASVFANEINSTTAEEVYRFMKQLCPMERFKGERKFQELAAAGFTLRNEVYSNGLQISIDDINDDKLDLVKPQVQMLAQQAALLWNMLMAALLDAGITDVGFDGVAYFHATHPLKAGTQRNTRTGFALTSANFITAFNDFETMKGWSGTVLGIKPTLLVVHPDLRATAEAIVELGPLLVGGSGAPNPNYKKCDLQVNPFLKVADHWYLLDLGKPIKPFVKQNRTPAAFYMDTNPNAESVKKYRRVEAYAELRGAMGYGMWPLAFCGQA